MYSTVCTERVSASGGSNVKDPVLNIVAASKNNDDSIEAVWISSEACDSGDGVWENFSIREGVFTTVGAGPGFNRGCALVAGAWKVTELEG